MMGPDIVAASVTDAGSSWGPAATTGEAGPIAAAATAASDAGWIAAAGATAMDRTGIGGLDAERVATAGVAIAPAARRTSGPSAVSEAAAAAGAGPTEDVADWLAASDGPAPPLAGVVSTGLAGRSETGACSADPPSTGSASGSAVRWSFRVGAGFASGGDITGGVPGSCVRFSTFACCGPPAASAAGSRLPSDPAAGSCNDRSTCPNASLLPVGVAAAAIRGATGARLAGATAMAACNIRLLPPPGRPAGAKPSRNLRAKTEHAQNRQIERPVGQE
jgi:hypothetical protein